MALPRLCGQYVVVTFIFIFQNLFIQLHGKTDGYIIIAVILVSGVTPPGLSECMCIKAGFSPSYMTFLVKRMIE